MFASRPGNFFHPFYYFNVRLVKLLFFISIVTILISALSIIVPIIFAINSLTADSLAPKTQNQLRWFRQQYPWLRHAHSEVIPHSKALTIGSLDPAHDVALRIGKHIIIIFWVADNKIIKKCLQRLTKLI